MKPKRFVLGAHTWKITWSDGDATGHMTPDTLTVLVEGDRPREGETLLHELIHACMYTSGLLRKPDESDGGAAYEEAFVEPFTQRLYELIRRNPHIIDYLMESE